MSLSKSPTPVPHSQLTEELGAESINWLGVSINLRATLPRALNESERV